VTDTSDFGCILFDVCILVLTLGGSICPHFHVFVYILLHYLFFIIIIIIIIIIFRQGIGQWPVPVQKFNF
jgi:hypothetical protein